MMDKNHAFKDEYFFLSNMYPLDEEYYISHSTNKELKFSTSEAYYQAMKVKDEKLHFIFTKLTGKETKRLSSHIYIREDWHDIKLDVMRYVLKEKFKDPLLAKKLIDMKEPIVEYNHWEDRYWGVYEGEGANHLGKLLEVLKRELIKG